MRTHEEDNAKNRLFVSCLSAENFHSQIARLKKNRPYPLPTCNHCLHDREIKTVDNCPGNYSNQPTLFLGRKFSNDKKAGKSK